MIAGIWKTGGTLRTAAPTKRGGRAMSGGMVPSAAARDDLTLRSVGEDVLQGGIDLGIEELVACAQGFSGNHPLKIQ